MTSITQQLLVPDEILVIDGSIDNDTQKMLNEANFKLPIRYLQVSEQNRGLTKQRNFGIQCVNPSSKLICFLDDDIILDKNYFNELLLPFINDEKVIGCSGYITNESRWIFYDPHKHIGKRWFIMDGFALYLSNRHYLRRLLGLFPNVPPGYIPFFGHGYDAVPPCGKIYDCEHIMGGITAYRYSIFGKLKFSEYFVGYGLYEDFDFSVRASKYGKLIINTKAILEHHHNPSGRPDLYKYGKMVTRNGWYVWRLKHRHPPFSAKIKWYQISLLLSLILLKSINKKSSLMEFIGRMVGLVSVIFNPPIIKE